MQVDLTIIQAVIVLVLLSGAFNLSLVNKLKVKDSKIEKLELELKEIKEKPKPDSRELTDFLADMASGKAGVFAVARVDPNDILIRSPRGQS